MPELLLELLSEEIPARMQARAAEDLKRLITASLEKDKLNFESLQTTTRTLQGSKNRENRERIVGGRTR